MVGITTKDVSHANMQKDSGISNISAKCSSEAIIVNDELNFVDFQVRYCLISITKSMIKESTATVLH